MIRSAMFSEQDECQLIHADISDILDSIPSESVQLVLTSPPYNVGKVYERELSMSLNEYLSWLTPIIEGLCTKVRPGGSICWQVGSFVKEGELFPLDFFFYDLFIRQGFKLRNRIVWRFNFGLHATKRLSGRYETLLWFTKSDEYLFNLDVIRIPQIYPGKRHSIKKGADRSGKLSGNPMGKNPADFWTFSAEECFVSNPVWDIPNVKANHPEQTNHPCQFPHELAERCILAFSKPGDLILDPFVGAGTTAIAAVKAGRRTIGIDKNDKYIQMATMRVASLKEGSLKLRASGAAIEAPSSRLAVARMPLEWYEAAE